MTHVVTEPCVDCKYTDCCVVCPVECFWAGTHDGKAMLVIDPGDCIDCEACVPECPVEAIYTESAVPAQYTQFIKINADMAADLKQDSANHCTEKGDPVEGPSCKKK
jgi:ferredoxin